jgi:hypothetical protein
MKKLFNEIQNQGGLSGDNSSNPTTGGFQGFGSEHNKEFWPEARF